MIKHYCDSCEAEESPTHLTKVTPGYIGGDRYVCPACWGKWVNFVLEFFKERKEVPDTSYDEEYR